MAVSVAENLHAVRQEKDAVIEEKNAVIGRLGSQLENNSFDIITGPVSKPKDVSSHDSLTSS